MKKIFVFLSLIACQLMGCVMFDESTYITDDQGRVHHTVHYTLDSRGRKHFPLEVTPTGYRFFVFDPKAFAWAAYDAYGHRRMTGAASGGMDFCPDTKRPCRTVTGEFRMYYKKGEHCLSREYPLDKIGGGAGGAKMPYCMYFYRGFTIHSAYEVPKANRSHGCIRVWPSAAKWLNEEFMKKGTPVIVLPYADENGNNKAD